MAYGKSLSALVVVLALSGAKDVVAQSPTRGTVKVQPRFFNPFDLETSRLRIDPFGFFTLLPSSPLIGIAAVTSPLSTPSAAVTASPAAAPSTTTTDTVAPAFRPDPRSPFRPPTRPPFM